MPTVGNIVVQDSSAADVTFKPLEVGSSLVKYADDTAIMAGKKTLSLGRRLPTSGNGNYKASIRLRIPVLVDNTADVNAAPAELYALSANVDIVVNERAAATERADLLALLVDALGDASLASLITSYELPY